MIRPADLRHFAKGEIERTVWHRRVGRHLGYAATDGRNEQIFVYDAKTGFLGGIRGVLPRGVVQAAFICASRKEFAKEAFARDRDWRAAGSLDSSTFHRQANREPLVTYTWLSPGHEPVVSIEPVEAVQRRLFEGVPRALGITQPSVTVNFVPSGLRTPQLDRFHLFGVEDREAAAAHLQERISTRTENTVHHVTVGEYALEAPALPTQQIDQMTEIMRAVSGRRLRGFVSRAVDWMNGFDPYALEEY